MEDRISEERLDKYVEITRNALAKLKIACPPRSFGRKIADDFVQMAVSYFEDAEHFKQKGDFVNAFACVNYAHGWLDCGARLGLFDVGEDDKLFTLYE
ncbi:MAG: DUF357 domain-containing protein [Methanomassiliicoccales archaeon]|nr:DUF357 domain-containing protein [Methanomassiliicoccales archaeon]